MINHLQFKFIYIYIPFYTNKCDWHCEVWTHFWVIASRTYSFRQRHDGRIRMAKQWAIAIRPLWHVGRQAGVVLLNTSVSGSHDWRILSSSSGVIFKFSAVCSISMFVLENVFFFFIFFVKLSSIIRMQHLLTYDWGHSSIRTHLFMFVVSCR